MTVHYGNLWHCWIQWYNATFDWQVDRCFLANKEFKRKSGLYFSFFKLKLISKQNKRFWVTKLSQYSSDGRSHPQKKWFITILCIRVQNYFNYFFFYIFPTEMFICLGTICQKNTISSWISITKRNGIAIWKVILDYETQTIFLSVSGDPVWFGPVVMKKQGLL